MAIKFKAKSKEEIPSELQSLYVEREGGFVLNVEGAVEKSKVEEVRGTNAALLKERDGLNARLKSLRSLCSPRLCVYLFASIFLPFTSSLPSFPFCSIF